MDRPSPASFGIPCPNVRSASEVGTIRHRSGLWGDREAPFAPTEPWEPAGDVNNVLLALRRCSITGSRIVNCHIENFGAYARENLGILERVAALVTPDLARMIMGCIPILSDDALLVVGDLTFAQPHVYAPFVDPDWSLPDSIRGLRGICVIVSNVVSVCPNAFSLSLFARLCGRFFISGAHVCARRAVGHALVNFCRFADVENQDFQLLFYDWFPRAAVRAQRSRQHEECWALTWCLTWLLRRSSFGCALAVDERVLWLLAGNIASDSESLARPSFAAAAMLAAQEWDALAAVKGVCSPADIERWLLPEGVALATNMAFASLDCAEAVLRGGCLQTLLREFSAFEADLKLEVAALLCVVVRQVSSGPLQALAGVGFGSVVDEMSSCDDDQLRADVVEAALAMLRINPGCIAGVDAQSIATIRDLRSDALLHRLSAAEH